jgi:hypothetical protein
MGNIGSHVDITSGVAAHQAKLRIYKRCAIGYRAFKMSSIPIPARLPDGKEFDVFTEAHPRFMAALDQIAAGYTDLFTAIEDLEGSKERRVNYLLLGASYAEFEETLVLAVNGYGFGATKLLRGLYERTVTVQYLMKHPDKVQQFIDYTRVHWKKLLIEGDTNGVGKQLAEERRKEIEAEFAEVEKRFTETVCKCGKTRLQGSWTKKPVPSQARELSDMLGTLCFQGYLIPTFFLHTTFWGVTQQLRDVENGKRKLHHIGSERHFAARGIVIAVNLMGHLAYSANDYFQLNAKDNCDRIMAAVNTIGKELLIDVEKEISGDDPPAEPHPEAVNPA